MWHLTPLAEQKFQRTQLGANFAQPASAAAAKTRKYCCRWEKIRQCSKINRSSIGIPRCRQFASPENQRARRALARALRYCSLQGNRFRAVRLEWVVWCEGYRQGQNIIAVTHHILQLTWPSHLPCRLVSSSFMGPGLVMLGRRLT